MINQDTICAVSTAPGAGGIAVIRVSGPEAIAICNTIFVPRTAGKDLLSQKAYTLRYGSIRRGEELIDEVLVALFRAPHSFTGEDTVEITCHGSVYIQQQIMQLLIESDCRSALPGEYTQRAFMNGKMDLSQAEAVADLIASTSAGQHRLALNQMRGGFSHELKNLREQLLHITSLMELELDFSDHEELEFADRSELEDIARQIEQVIHHLVDTFSVGNALKNGVPVAIVGETNAGKSTLLNALLNEERAIVSDIHGTTRDVIEDTMNLGGITFRFIDTAGIRETTDTIESLGIERSFQKLDQADIVLWVIDATCAEEQYRQLADKILPRCEVCTNVHFPVFLLQRIITRIKKGGSVVFTGSLMGIEPHSVSLAYGVTKSAVHSLVKNLVKFLVPYEVRVNGVAPGFVDTEWQKNKPAEIRRNIERKVALGRFCDPMEVAEVYKMLIENSYFNGEVVVVDGGYSYK